MNLTIKRIYAYKNKHLFSAISLLTLLFMFLLQHRLLDIDVFYNMMGNQLSSDQIENMFKIQLEYQWIAYLLTPLMLLVKTIFASLFIHMVMVFADIEVTFKNIFKINLVAGAAYLLTMVAQVVIIYSLDVNEITNNTLLYGSLSLALLGDPETTLVPLYALMGFINPYEVLYIGLTVLGINKVLDLSKSKAIKFAIGIWITFIIFNVVVQSFIKLNMQ